MATPPPLTPYQKDHIGDDRGSLVTVVSSVMIGLSTAAVLLRLIARASRKMAIGIDDLLAVGAWVFVVLFCVTCIISVPYGMGKHSWATDPSKSWQIIHIGEYNALIYVIVHWFIKMSILAFFKRVFTLSIPWFRWAVYALAVYVTGWFIGVFFAALFQCIPVAYFWEQFNSTLNPPAHGHCGVVNPDLVISSSALNTVADILIFFLPLARLWQMNLRRHIQLALTAVFATGAVAVAAGIVRLTKTLSAVKPTADVTWITAEIYMWTAVEAAVGLICACLPVIGSLFRIMKDRVTSWISQRSSTEDLRRPKSHNNSWPERAMGTIGSGEPANIKMKPLNSHSLLETTDEYSIDQPQSHSHV